MPIDKRIAPAVAESLSVLRRVLAEIDWQPEADSSATNFFVDLELPDSPIAYAQASIAPETSRFVLYLSFARNIPPRRRAAAALSIARINWGLLIGNFEVDLDDGQVRFKCSIDFSSTRLDAALVRNAVLASMQAVEQHAPTIIKVADEADPAVPGTCGS
jgi:hypothetical protein